MSNPGLKLRDRLSAWGHTLDAFENSKSPEDLYCGLDEVFPNAACVVSLIDRLVHHSEASRITEFEVDTTSDDEGVPF